MNRPYCLSILTAAVFLAIFSTLAAAEPVKLQVRDETIDGPGPGIDRAAWLVEMTRWRDAERKRIKYDDAQYARPELQWAQRSFVQPQMMAEERYFYDPDAGKYTVDRYIDVPPYAWDGDARASLATGQVHLKLALDGFPSTCFGIWVEKAPAT